MNIFINIAIYQAVWFLCVLLENRGALLALPLLLLHLYLSPCKADDIHLMVKLLVLGCVVDGTLHALDFIRYNVAAVPIPLWLAIIWLALATLPHHSLHWLKGRYPLCAALGICAGPLAYWAGVQCGAAHFRQPLAISLVVFALLWAGILPLCMYLAQVIQPKNTKV